MFWSSGRSPAAAQTFFATASFRRYSSERMASSIAASAAAVRRPHAVDSGTSLPREMTSDGALSSYRPANSSFVAKSNE
jgi:hypothetical protein